MKHSLARLIASLTGTTSNQVGFYLTRATPRVLREPTDVYCDSRETALYFGWLGCCVRIPGTTVTYDWHGDPITLTAREQSLVRMTALKLHAHYVATHGGDSTLYDLQVTELELVSEAEQDQIGDVIEDVVTC